MVSINQEIDLTLDNYNFEEWPNKFLWDYEKNMWILKCTIMVIDFRKINLQ